MIIKGNFQIARVSLTINRIILSSKDLMNQSQQSFELDI